MSDLPLPKPPKSTTITVGNKLKPPIDRLVTQASSSTNTHNSTLSSSASAVAKPPAAVTALSSVMPSGLPQGANQPGVDKPSERDDQGHGQISFSDNLKVSTPNGESESVESSSNPTTTSVASKFTPPPVTTSPSVAAASSPPPPLLPTTPSRVSQPQSSSRLAKPKKSWLSFLPFVFIGLAVVLLLAVVALRLTHKKSSSSASLGIKMTDQTDKKDNSISKSQVAKKTEKTSKTNANQPVINLEYWGLWEPESVMQPIISQFEKQNPGVSIRYTKQSYKNYRERLQTAIASGNGPDIFRFHASWTPMLTNELAPLPASIMSLAQFKKTFYPVATHQLQLNGQIIGLPLMYDGLVLYYNQDIFQAAGVSPPKTWAQVRSLASKLTLKEQGKLKRAGLAAGTAENTDHFSDILAILMLQNGAKLTKPDSAEVRDALTFYTNFVTSDKVWNEQMPNSTVAFAKGEAAMMFGPSWSAHQIKAINPQLKFATAPLPQLANERLTWANFWAEGVSKKSKQQALAWKFLHFLTSKATEQQLFAEEAKVRSFGEPYSRVDLADKLASDPLVSAVIEDAPYATNWYLNSNTFDNGINDQLIKYYQDAVNAVLGGKPVDKVITTLKQGTEQVLGQYNVKN